MRSSRDASKATRAERSKGRNSLPLLVLPTAPPVELGQLTAKFEDGEVYGYSVQGICPDRISELPG